MITLTNNKCLAVYLFFANHYYAYIKFILFILRRSVVVFSWLIVVAYDELVADNNYLMDNVQSYKLIKHIVFFS